MKTNQIARGKKESDSDERRETSGERSGKSRQPTAYSFGRTEEFSCREREVAEFQNGKQPHALRQF